MYKSELEFIIHSIKIIEISNVISIHKNMKCKGLQSIFLYLFIY